MDVNNWLTIDDDPDNHLERVDIVNDGAERHNAQHCLMIVIMPCGYVNVNLVHLILSQDLNLKILYRKLNTI